MIVSIIVYIVILADQLTKWWAHNKLRLNGEIELIRDFLYFEHDTNDGMAFGLLDDHRWIFLSMTTLILAAIIIFLYKTRVQKKHILLNASLGLIVGGGISNMIDRVFFGTELFCGEVVDFIKVINFANFNVADSAVCIGEALLLIYVFFIDSKCADPEKNLFSFSSKDAKSLKHKKEDQNV